MRMATIRSTARATLVPTGSVGDQNDGPLITAGVGAGVTEDVTGSGVGVGAGVRSRATPAVGPRSVPVAPSRSSTCENVPPAARCDVRGSDAVRSGRGPETVVGVGEGSGLTVRGGEGDGVSDGDGSSDGLGDGVSDGDGDGLSATVAFAESAPPTTASKASVAARKSCFFNPAPDRPPL
jgi:hypothetical protein